MKVIKSESIYSEEVIFDASRLGLLNTRNPLYIAAREGQKMRIQKLIGNNGRAVGVWELGDTGYINQDGSLNEEAFKEHGVIFTAEPHRVHEAMRPAYERLVATLEGI